MSGLKFAASSGLLYGCSMPKLQPTGTKTIQLESPQTSDFLCFVWSLSDGVSGEIGLITRRSSVQI